MDVNDFDFNKLVGYVPAGCDEKLIQLGHKLKKRFVTTTSSTTQLLCHLYYVISHWKPFDVSCLSAPFQRFSRQYSRTLTFPPSVRLKKHEGGVYSINADKSFEDETKVLARLGQLLERMLTMTPENFAKYKLEPQPDGEAQALDQRLPKPELSTYNYTFTKNMVLRAQLDCADKRLPRKIFDLKTRASLPIRLDQSNYKDYLSYDISSQLGVHESFEREYYDLIRSAFLKYSFQVRIGQMDGCLVAYHNTETLYGFQYVSLPEMDARLFENSVMGEQAFANSMQLLEILLTEITTKYPEDELLITLNTMEESLIVQVYIEFIDKDKPNMETIPMDKASICTVDPFSRLAKFQLVCHSFVNGEKLTKPVSLNSASVQDAWEVHYTLKEVKLDPLDLYNEYLTMRHTQATFYDFDRENLPLLQRIRAMTGCNVAKPSPKPKPM
ncbi:hypothetical protein L0F63_004533, partial [Massospora cicadina]